MPPKPFQSPKLPFSEVTVQIEKSRQMAFSYVLPDAAHPAPQGTLHIISYLEYALAIDVGLHQGVAVAVVKGNFEGARPLETWYQASEAPDASRQPDYISIPLHAFQYVRYRGLPLLSQLKLLNTLSGLETIGTEPCRRCDWSLFLTGRAEPCFKCRSQR